MRIRVGKDRGKTGKITRVFPKTGRVTIDGLNTVKRHVKPRRQGEQGEVVTVSRSIPAANVALVCPSCSKMTRPGMRLENDAKVRFCKKCGTAF